VAVKPLCDVATLAGGQEHLLRLYPRHPSRPRHRQQALTAVAVEAAVAVAEVTAVVSGANRWTCAHRSNTA
jgi:hypothetical protein